MMKVYELDLSPLILFSSKLIDPTKLGGAVLAGDVAHHVPARQHYAVLNFGVDQVHHFVE